MLILSCSVYEIGAASIFLDGFTLGFIRVSTPYSTQVADVVKIYPQPRLLSKDKNYSYAF
jgi:hypothetical protein